MKTIGYLINQYPIPSGTFIRREIAAIEAEGATVHRYAVRSWNGTLVDPDDIAEVARTRRVLDGGLPRLALATVATLGSRPGKFFQALAAAGRLARAAGRGRLKHLVYLAEACVLLGWTRRDRVDHIHAHFGTNSTVVALLCRLLGGPTYSFTVHGPEEFDHPVELALGEKIRHAAFVVAIGSFGRSQLWRWARHEDWPKVHVVHCGLDPRYLDATPTLPAPARRLVNIGRLEEQKGQLILVAAAAVLVARGRGDFEIVIIGGGQFREVLEAAISERGLGDRVRLAGWMTGEQIRRELVASRGFVMPSFAEGLPVVIMEALALHRPVIATYVASIPELVRPGETGWLVPAGDVEALADAMLALLDTPTDRLVAMGAAGALAVQEEHDVRTEARKLLDLINRGIIEPRDRPPLPPAAPAVPGPGA